MQFAYGDPSSIDSIFSLLYLLWKLFIWFSTDDSFS